ncbi:MAG: WhiB family transcriptional regulator [Saccharopolyspora sp.]|uniref:WhiB family transcriptional regulator n=1 Tax=Saccharopolyspora TaxID=1835 RepID=UPI00190991DB|nr:MULTISPECIES: WhiB family transcriptional regulator [unclassified Saccharopolyspora]MBK0869938.1 WhiB family transcriptional regulator [Saccharopolyspora sp. HNM0986]MBQ6640120.1 WhiB family transcriptional regulator [Saccharopolyspora sp.]
MTATMRLPKPVAETWEWQLQAACRDLSTSKFFHPENERGSARSNREEQAKQICRRCPVMLACREHALAAQEPYGVWGGLGERERQDLIAKRMTPQQRTAA